MPNHLVRPATLALSLSATVFAYPCAEAAPGKPTTLPNVVIMLADDAGYADFGCYGSEHIKSPNIDQLATEGMRCTDFYSAAPNCSPSRAGLLTGRIPARAGIYNYIDPGSPMHLTRKEVTLASVLRPLGYQTCVTGKWHLSSDLENKAFPSPADHGFDDWFCVHNNAKPSHKDPKNFIRNGKPVGKLEGYSCQIVVDEAIGWLKKRDKNKPFFLYIPFNEPHERVASPPELIAKHTGTAKEKKYYANIENLDNAVGRFLAYLREAGLENSTFVLFTSDNGPKPPGSAAPLRGIKSDIWDGGIREPGIMRWPGHIRPGTVCSEPLGVVDVLPTICEMTGAPLPPKRVIDGTSMLPAFKGDKLQRKTPLFWFFYNASPALAMREGDWMLIGYLDPPGYKLSHSLQAKDMPYIHTSKIDRVELYNLREDIGQKSDVSHKNPERAERMKASMTAIHREVLSEKPAWNFENPSKE
jgi:arylsulfatase A